MYMKQALEAGFQPILQGVVDIARRTRRYGKYYHLLFCLSELGFLELPPKLDGYLYPPRRGLAKRLSEVKVNMLPVDCRIYLTYIAPQRPADLEADACLDFDHIIAFLRSSDDELSRLLWKYLDRWK